MKKKVTTRPRRKTRVNTKYSTNKLKIFYTKFYVLGFVVLAVTAGLFGYKTGDQPLVLGTSILAENGPDGAKNAQDMHMTPPSDDNASNMSKDALVDCVGPDGKHIRSTFEDCAALNKKWNRQNFNYTVLKPQMTPIRPVIATGSGMQKKNGRPGFPNQRPQSSASADVQFGEHPNTSSLTAKNAVERVLQTRALSSIENAASSAATVPGSTPNTELTQINNQPVYKINGFANKKVFGIFPAAFAKTVYVSANDGQVVKTDQTFLSKVLEGMSF